MKLKREFIIHNTGSETVLVPTGSADFSGLVRGNATLERILRLLLNDTDEERIVDAMCAEFDAPREKIAQDVAKAIDELRRIGAIEE